MVSPKREETRQKRLEKLIADAHFDVVSLSGEDQERLVLGLPTEAGDRAVIAVVIGLFVCADGVANAHEIEMPDAQSKGLGAAIALSSVGLLIVDNGLIVNLLY